MKISTSTPECGLLHTQSAATAIAARMSAISRMTLLAFCLLWLPALWASANAVNEPNRAASHQGSGPIIDLFPDNLHVTLMPDQAGSRDIEVKNLGNEALQWQILDEDVIARVGGLTLDSGENTPRAVVIDPAGEFAYFGTNTSPGRVVKIDLETFESTATIVLDASENLLGAATIDPAGQFAYFGTGVSPGGSGIARIVKIDLATFTRADSIELDLDDRTVVSATMDPAGEYAYFGVMGAPGAEGVIGRIVKVDVANFEHVETVILQPGETLPDGLVIDPAAEFAYFGAGTNPGKVIKIELETFSRISTLSLGLSGSVRSAIIDPTGTFAYFGMLRTGGSGFPGQLAKVDLSTFEHVDTLTMPTGENGFASAVIDPQGAFAFFGTQTTPGRAVKIDLHNFQRVTAVTLQSGENNLIGAAAIDPAGKFAYFGTGTSPGRVIKVRTNNLLRDCTLPDWIGADPVNGSVSAGQEQTIDISFDTQGLAVGSYDANLCFGSNDPVEPLLEVPVDLSIVQDEPPVLDISPSHLDFEVPRPTTHTDILSIGNVGSAQLSWQITHADSTDGCDTPSDIEWLSTLPTSGSTTGGSVHEVEVTVDVSATDAGAYAALLCVTTNDPHAPLVAVPVDLTVQDAPPVIDVNPASLSESVELDQTESTALSIFNRGEEPLAWSVLQQDIGLHRVDSVVLDADLGFMIEASVIDPAGEFAYFAMRDVSVVPGRVVKVDLNTLQQIESVTLDHGENNPRSAVIDPLGQFAYFGTQTSPGRVVKVDLATMQRVDAITLSQGEDELFAAAIDPQGEFAYFGTRTEPGQVIKIDLSTLQRVDAITLNSDESFLDSAVIDPAGRYAYFGGLEMVETPVVKIDLDTFERVGSTVVTAIPYGSVTSAVIDPQGHFAYFGLSALVSPNGGGELVKVDLTSFRRVDAIQMEGENERRLNAALIDPDGLFAYFGVGDGAGLARVVKFDLENFVRVDTVSFGAGESTPTTVVLDPDSRYAYFGSAMSPIGSSPASVVKFDLGQTCALPAWLTADPVGGDIPGDDQQSVTLSLDTAGLVPGDYEANLCLTSNDAVNPMVTVPVDLAVQLPADYATIEGVIIGQGYCGADPAPLAGSTVQITGATGAQVTVHTDADGYYDTYLPDSESPLSFEVSAPGHLTGSVEGVVVVGGEVVVQDLDLVLDMPCVTATPDSLVFDLPQDQSDSQALDIGNTDGGAALDWALEVSQPAMVVEDSRGRGTAGPGVGSGRSDIAAALEPGEGPAMGWILPASVDGFDCDGAEGLIVHDDGTVETAYSANAAQVGTVTIVERFTSAAPGLLGTVCVSFVSQAPETLDFELMVFDSDGPDGAPGTELAAVSVTATGLDDTRPYPAWVSVDLSGAGILVRDGAVYIGARWAPSVPGVFLSADEDGPGGGGGYFQADGGAWDALANLFPDYQAMFVRPQVLTHPCYFDPGGAPWLSVAPASGSVAPGATASAQVTVNTAGLSVGSHEGSLCLASNDPVQPMRIVPVELTVKPGDGEPNPEDSIFSDHFEVQPNAD